MSEWKQIHAQIDAIIRAIPEHFLLDPPDGGDVTVAEGVQRMATRIEQLEAEGDKARARGDRMRMALEDIAYPNPLHNEDDLMRIARAALEEGLL